MAKCRDLTGQKFNRWTALKRMPPIKRQSVWLCKCDCGTEKVIYQQHLISGMSKSCWCYGSEVNAKLAYDRAFRHGYYGTRTYHSWQSMKRRCLPNASAVERKNYYLKGITVCDRWSDFSNFLEDMGERPKGTTIDRIDGSKGYYKNNCRWATSVIQGRNRCNVPVHNIRGYIGTVSELAGVFGIKYMTVKSRVNICGWSIERALTEPVKYKKYKR